MEFAISGLAAVDATNGRADFDGDGMDGRHLSSVAGTADAPSWEQRHEERASDEWVPRSRWSEMFFYVGGLR